MVLAACLSSLMLLSGHVGMIVFSHEWYHRVLITRGKNQDCEASRLKHAENKLSCVQRTVDEKYK